MPANQQPLGVQVCIKNHPNEPRHIVLSDQSDIQTVSSKVRNRMDNARFVVAITGAGISRASGLPLLKDAVCGVPLSEFFQGKLFRENPGRFYSVYREMLKQWDDVEPNSGHLALAERGAWVITQNIDGLHRLAGTHHLIELHGNFRELRCETCGSIESSRRVLTEDMPFCPRCKSLLVPGIVMEGQEVRHVSLAMDWVGRAEVLFIVGTKMSSDPVARIPQAAGPGTIVLDIQNHAETILPNLLHQTKG